MNMSYTSNFTGPQIDEAVDKVLNGGNVKVVTIWVPSKETFMMDSIDSTLLEKNKESFQVLKNQTEPMLIFLQELGDVKPYAQVAMRMRHLDAQGEGRDFFAFGYYVPYTSEDKYGLLAYADDMFKLHEDGYIEMITLLGDTRYDYFQFSYPAIVGNYNQKFATSATVSNSPAYVKLFRYGGGSGNCIRNLFDCGSDMTHFLSNEEYNANNWITSFVVKGGWTHPTMGPVESDCVFDVDYTSGTWPVIRLREPITIGGWANIDMYELHFKELA